MGTREGKYYLTFERLPIDKERVAIFTLKTTKKKTWYVRILKRKGKGYFQKSLGTENKDTAIELARALYLSLWRAEEKGVEFHNVTFTATFHEFLKHGNLSKHRHTRVKGVFCRYFQPFFKEMAVGEMDEKTWNDYLRFRVDFWRKAEEDGKLRDQQIEGIPVYNYKLVPRETTLKSERQILRQFLYYCLRNRYIERVPYFSSNLSGIVGVVYNDTRIRSKALTPNRERDIERELRRYCITDGQKDRNALKRFARARLYYFVQICKHALIRPSTEAVSLKWLDISTQESRKHPGHTLALINIRSAKTGKPRVAVMPYGQVHYITSYHEYCKEFGFGKPGDFVFPKWGSDEAVEPHIISRLLRDKLLKWGLHRDEEGKVISMYSLVRHTGITRRIERSNWDVGRTATAAGTSIKQISTYYYEAFAKQNPDRWAITFKGGIPKIEEKKLKSTRDAAAKYEEWMDGFDENEE